MLNQDSGYGGGDPLAFCDLDADNILIIYDGGRRGSGTRGNSKGQGNGEGGVGGLWNNPSLSTVVLLLGSSEGEVDLVECGVEDVNQELLQVTVEGVGVQQFEDWSRQEGEGSVKWEAKDVR